jgi:hypothetical protein
LQQDQGEVSLLLGRGTMFAEDMKLSADQSLLLLRKEGDSLRVGVRQRRRL